MYNCMRNVKFICSITNLNASDLSGVSVTSSCKHMMSALSCLPVCKASVPINTIKTKRRLVYLKTQSVPRSKHFSTRL